MNRSIRFIPVETRKFRGFSGCPFHACCLQQAIASQPTSFRNTMGPLSQRHDCSGFPPLSCFSGTMRSLLSTFSGNRVVNLHRQPGSTCDTALRRIEIADPMMIRAVPAPRIKSAIPLTTPRKALAGSRVRSAREPYSIGTRGLLLRKSTRHSGSGRPLLLLPRSSGELLRKHPSPKEQHLPLAVIQFLQFGRKAPARHDAQQRTGRNVASRRRPSPAARTEPHP